MSGSVIATIGGREALPHGGAPRPASLPPLRESPDAIAEGVELAGIASEEIPLAARLLAAVGYTLVVEHDPRHGRIVYRAFPGHGAPASDRASARRPPAARASDPPPLAYEPEGAE
ncbi:MAG: hypothetical protein HOQ09_00835, partial [Gemmatimonadaceae bacterium]|nr:hypothetical protein [Gemmatimonadaceae bacterium]